MASRSLWGRRLWRPGLVLAAVGTAYLWFTGPQIRVSYVLPGWYSNPRIVPVLTGAGMIALGCVLALLQSSPAVEKAAAARRVAFGGPGRQLSDLAWNVTLLAAYFLYAVSMPYLGFIVPTILLMAVQMLVLGERNRLTIAVLSIMYAAAVHAMFVEFLGVPLPKGMIGF